MSGPTPLPDALTARLTERLRASFPQRPPPLRRLGREAEYPVVNPDGTAADLQPLFRRLGETGWELKTEGDLLVGALGECDVLLEVGRGTLEIVTPPCADLHELRRVHERAMAAVVHAATSQAMLVLGLGMQPVTGPVPELMSPKERYFELLRLMGPPWLAFATTASDQVHVDIGRDEALPLTNLLNLLSPITLALCGNSPIAEGRIGPMCGREPALQAVYPQDHRHGMLPGPYARLEDHVARIADLPYLLQGGVPFRDWVADRPGVDVWAAFLHHERYVWNYARPRAAIGTIEVRAACQQPWEEHDAAAVLGTAMVCAADALADLMHQALGPEAWPAMHTWRQQVVALGLAAPEPVPGLIGEVLDRCMIGLARRGRGEEALLGPLYDRVGARRSPGEAAIDALSEGGLDGLLDRTHIGPERFC